MHRETLPNTLLTDNVLNNGEEYLSRDKWYINLCSPALEGFFSRDAICYQYTVCMLGWLYQHVLTDRAEPMPLITDRDLM